MRASVVIPTKNPGTRFAGVLAAVLSQETPWPFEILVIDSGSTDGTVELCEQMEHVRLHQIAPQDFGHGKTRNLGIALTKGEMIAMITQDALPADNRWLVELVDSVSQSDDIAGAFGRHLPYPDCNPFVARDINRHFDNFAHNESVTWMKDADVYLRDIQYRQFLHFFSDNNACLRRSVWQRIPYPEVDFAEDQLWAKTVIEAGYKKAYANNARVFHSHNYGAWETLRRSYDESRAFAKHFSYRLCPSLWHAITRAARTTVEEYRYSVKKRIIWRSPAWLAKIPTQQLCRYAGLYLGTKTTWQRELFDKIFSLDQANKKA